MSFQVIPLKILGRVYEGLAKGAEQTVSFSSALVLCVCRSAAAGHRVVQGCSAHRPGEDAPLPGAGGRQPAGQRPPARRHGDVSVLCSKPGGRSSDQHLPGCDQ